MAATDLPARSLSFAQRGYAGALAVLTALCFAQSYRQLITFAARHGQEVPWIWIWPAMLDGFTLLGEAGILIAVLRRLPRYLTAAGAVVALAGFGASLAANIGYQDTTDWVTRATSAAAPAFAAVGMCLALLLLEFTARKAQRDAETEERRAERRAQRAERAAALQRAADAERAAAVQREALQREARSTLHLVSGPAARGTQAQRGAALVAQRDAGPQADAVRAFIQAELERGAGLPSQREAGRVKHDGVPAGARLAKRILDEFSGATAQETTG